MEDDRKLDILFFCTEGRCLEVFEKRDSCKKHILEDRHTTVGTDVTMMDNVYEFCIKNEKLSSQTLKPLAQCDYSIREENIKHISDTYPLLQIFLNMGWSLSV